LFPIGIGFVRTLGERRGFYDSAFGTSARTLCEIVLFGAIVWWTANGVSRQARAARQAEQALRQADRRKDEFLATLAHELRNPLAPLRHALEILRTHHDDATRVERARTIMQRQLGQLVHLVDDLLDISRISRGSIELREERIDILEAVESAIETSRPVIDANGHHLTVDKPAEPIAVEGDMTRLAQVIGNLLDNAAKYTPRGGRIDLTVRREGAEIVVRVRDSGVGIPPAVLPRVFEMFTRVGKPVDRPPHGLGIGLALVRQLVELHGGSIEVHSPPPQANGSDAAGEPLSGTEFAVRLPALDLAGTETGPTPLVAPPVDKVAVGERAGTTAPRLRVLIADDNIDAAELLGMLLEEMGHEIRAAHDGRQALDVARGFRPDVAILDIGMPEMTGYDVARAIRSEPWGSEIVLIALTGWGQAEDRARAKDQGFDHHLVKPVAPDRLEKVLASVRGTEG
jgi:signal transduction histidine kinase/CheY-like chemotaxis protein